MREKAQKFLKERGSESLEFVEYRRLKEFFLNTLIDFANQETEALQAKLNNERKMNESHVNSLLAQMADKNKTNL